VQLFVGLGNPGREHARQRHNIGFMALDAVAAREGAGGWRRKFSGEIAELRFGAEKVLLLKPLTYMNVSGQSVGEAMRFHGLDAAGVTVFHDELDLPPGKLRVKRGGGHAGHNGLRSIHQHIGADYRRVRLGIGHPGHKDRVSGYVLHDFPKAETAWVEPLLDALARAAGLLAEGRDEAFMTEVARHAPPPEATRKPAREALGDASDARAARREAAPRDATSREDAKPSPFDALKGLIRR